MFFNSHHHHHLQLDWFELQMICHEALKGSPLSVFLPVFVATVLSHTHRSIS